jgi:folate-binding protein YgfZ
VSERHGREYDAARSTAIVVERTDRALVRVHGRDPVRMVQGLITNDIANASSNRAVYAAVLTPKGKMVADVRVLRHGADLLLETDAEAKDALIAHLRKFVPPLFAKFESVDDAWAVLTVCGVRAYSVIAAAVGGVVPETMREDDAHDVDVDGTRAWIIATAQFDVPGCDVVVARAAADDVRERIMRAGAEAGGHGTLEVLRVEAGRPKWGLELDEATIPLEAGLRERAISESKGCYTGQEVIIRILHRGHVNRLLRGLVLGGVRPPARDTPLVIRESGRNVGRVTSAVWSPKHGQTIALGYVRREVEPGSTVGLGEGGGDGEAGVVALPFPADAAPELRNDR